jgi:hypothetical protein
MTDQIDPSEACGPGCVEHSGSADYGTGDRPGPTVGDLHLEAATLSVAGGWCAPSETIYNMAFPEVSVARGGITYGGTLNTPPRRIMELLIDPEVLTSGNEHDLGVAVTALVETALHQMSLQAQNPGGPLQPLRVSRLRLVVEAAQ